MQGTLAVLLAWDGGNLARSAENGRFPISWNGLEISLEGPHFFHAPTIAASHLLLILQLLEKNAL